MHIVFIGVNQPYLGGSGPLFDAKFRTFPPFLCHFPPFLGSLMPLNSAILALNLLDYLAPIS